MMPFFRVFNAVANNDFVRAVVVTIANRGVMIALATLTSVLVARGLGPEARGDYAYVTSMIAIISQFGLLGMHSANVVFASKSPEKAPNLFANSFLVGGGVSLVAGVLGVFWDQLYGAARLHEYVWFVVFAVVLQSVLLLIQQLSLGLQKIRLYNFIDLVPQVFVAVFVVAFFMLSNMNLKKMLMVNAVSPALGLIVCICGFAYLTKRLRCLHFDLDLFKGCFQYGWRIYVACILIAYFGKVEILSAGSRITSQQLGEYAVAFALFSMALIPAQVVGNILLPKLASIGSESRFNGLVRVLRVIVPLLLVFNLFLYGCAKILVLFLYGSEYLEAVSIFRVLLFGYLPFGLASLFSSFIAIDLLPSSLLFSYVVMVAMKTVSLYYVDFTVGSLAVINVVFNYLFFAVLSFFSLLKARGR